MRSLIFISLFIFSLNARAQSIAFNTSQQNTIETFKPADSATYPYPVPAHYYRNVKGIGGMVAGGLILVTGLGFYIVGSSHPYDNGDADHFFGTAFMLAGAITFLTAAVVHSLHNQEGNTHRMYHSSAMATN